MFVCGTGHDYLLGCNAGGATICFDLDCTTVLARDSLVPGLRLVPNLMSRKRKSIKWSAPLVASEVDAHPDLLSIPTFVLFVQKDELQMSRAEVRKEDRLEAQKEFEAWLSHQTAPRQAPPKKQMQNEESLAPVDDKERSAVAVRTHVQNGGPRGISRPSSDGFRPRAGQRPGGTSTQSPRTLTPVHG